jgi:gliding motility-associated-like protein
MTRTNSPKFLRSLFIACILCGLTASVKAQIVGTAAYIKATSVEIGLSGEGGFEGANTSLYTPIPGMHFRSGTQFFGFVANPAMDGWTNFDGDFFTPGTPENGWGVEVGSSSGNKGNNNCANPNDIVGSITDWTHNFDCYSVDWEGDMTSGTDLHFKINYFLQETDLFYTTTVSITNNTSATIPELYYHRNLDPDNNQTLSGDFTTQNTVVSQPGTGCNLAHVKATQSTPWNSYLGLAGLGANFRVCYGGFSNRDASDLWNGIGFTQTVGSTSFMDEAISLSYKIENLAPGATETFKFVVILDDSSSTAAINNLLYLFYPSSFTSPPSVCTPYTDTARTCGSAIPIGVLGTSVGDYNWSWSPGTGLSSTTGSSVIANPATTTTYTVSGTPITPCLQPVTLQIVVQVTPSEGADPIIAPVPPQCISNPAFNLTVDTLGGVWGGPGITNASTGTFDPASAGVGTHLITYVTPGLCNTTDTILITVATAAAPVITQPPTLCVADTAYALAASSGGGVWSGTGVTGGIFNPNAAGAGSHVINYTISSGSCSGTDTVTINVITAYDATISPATAICEGSAPFNLSAATSGGTWSGTGITNPTAGTFNPSTPGSFVVTYTISGSCGSSDTLHVNVIPNADATITAPAAVCANAPAFNLTAADAGGTWSGTGITSSSAGTFNPSVSGPGTFNITYTIAGACGATDNQLVTVNALPNPAFTTNVTSGCAPLCVTFDETASTNCASLVYAFGDDSTSVSSNPTHCYQDPGTYSVTITCTDLNSCVGTTVVTNLINVYAVPVASFTLTPGAVIAPNTSVTVTDMSTGGGDPFWEFGDPASGANNVGTGSPESHTYAQEGNYCITLISDNNGCRDTAKSCLLVIDDATVFIPNIFTPNSDGNNDLWKITTTGVKELTCEIYDRWGLKIATFDGTTSGWDGKTKNGKLAPDGTYFYVVRIVAINDKLTEKSGYLQLLRP